MSPSLPPQIWSLRPTIASQQAYPPMSRQGYIHRLYFRSSPFHLEQAEQLKEKLLAGDVEDQREEPAPSRRSRRNSPSVENEKSFVDVCGLAVCCSFLWWNIVDLDSPGATTGKGRRTSPFLATILFSSLHFLPPSSSTGFVSSQKIQINNDQTKQIFIQRKLHPLHQLLTVEPYRLALCFLCVSATRSQHAMAPSPDLDFPLPSGR